MRAHQVTHKQCPNRPHAPPQPSPGAAHPGPAPARGCCAARRAHRSAAGRSGGVAGCCRGGFGPRAAQDGFWLPRANAGMQGPMQAPHKQGPDRGTAWRAHAAPKSRPKPPDRTMQCSFWSSSSASMAMRCSVTGAGGRVEEAESVGRVQPAAAQACMASEGPPRAGSGSASRPGAVAHPGRARPWPRSAARTAPGAAPPRASCCR
jgi:hypothetical protein